MDNSTRQAKRAPVTLKIKFKSETLAQFIERYAVDVSPGGIFIRTKEPLAVGTPMKFEFQLRDATPLITGEGTVVWTRENDPARPNAAPGMGVRFDRLGEGSQPILDKILAEKAKSGAPSSNEPQQRLFTDAPTRVAPSPLVGQLIGESKGKSGDGRGGFGDERTDTTPLPKPVPFHSDAEEFPDETFEEATKVRTVEDLIAATAAGGSQAKPRATMVISSPPPPPPPSRTAPPASAQHGGTPLPAPLPIAPPPEEASAEADPPTTPIPPPAAMPPPPTPPTRTAPPPPPGGHGAPPSLPRTRTPVPPPSAAADAEVPITDADLEPEPESETGAFGPSDTVHAPPPVFATQAKAPAPAPVDVEPAAAAEPMAEAEVAPPPAPRKTPPMGVPAVEPAAEAAAAEPAPAAGIELPEAAPSAIEAAQAEAAPAPAEAAPPEPEPAPAPAEQAAPREKTPLPAPLPTAAPTPAPTPAAAKAPEPERAKPATAPPTGRRPVGVPLPPPELTDPNRKHGGLASAQIETAPPGMGVGIIIMFVVFALGLAALVWFFFIRNTPEDAPPTTTDEAPVVGSGSAPGTGSEPGSAPGSAVDAPPVRTNPARTELRATVPDALISIPGEDLSGPTPFVVELEKGEPYTARVTANGYKAALVSFMGGQKVAPVKLEPMSRILHVASTPPGATVLIDGESSGRKTPADFTLSARQAAKPTLKIGLTKAGFAPFEQELTVDDFAVDGDEMVMAIDAELQKK